MAAEQQAMIKAHWRTIEEKLGTQFNYEFWDTNTPRRSTYNACRAVIAAGNQGHQVAMVEAIQQAAAVGQRHFGENYLQEAVEKITKINDKSLSWHFIGTIQSNKTQAIAQHFQWVHTIDRIKIAQRLSAQRPEQLPPLNVCIQVNIDADKAKAGVETENCLVLARQIDQLPNIKLRGLMTITAMTGSDEQRRASFSAMCELFETIRKALDSEQFDSLSMGSSSIARVKSMIRFIEYPQAKKLLNVVLELDNAQDIEDYLHRNLHDISITPLIRPINR